MGCPLSPEMASKTCARSSPMSVLPAADRPPSRRNSPPCGAHRMLTHRPGLSMDDLISEGVVGMMEAINRFDPDQGARLATYAVFWVKAMVRDAARSRSVVKGAAP